MEARGYGIMRTLSWPLVLRWMLAILVAPLMPFVLITVALAPAIKGGAIDDSALFVVYFLALYSIPASWMFLPGIYWILERKGWRSLLAYTGAGALAALGGSLVVLPVAFLTVPIGAAVGACIWCALWLGRPNGRKASTPDQQWQVRSRVKAD